MYFSRLFLFFFSLSVLSCFVSAVMFDIRNGEEVCLGEAVTAGELLVAEYSILPSGSKMQVFMFDPSGNQIYSRLAGSEQSGVGAGAESHSLGFDHKFAHTASKTGEYRACFQNSVYSPNDGAYMKTVNYQVKTGLTTRDYAAVAKKDSLKPIEVHLKFLEDLTKNIHAELKYLSEREIVMRATNQSTSRFVVTFSVLSILVLVALKVAEGFYLKRYFQAKKILT